MLVTMDTNLKTCIRCETNWQTTQELLSDPKVMLLSYKVNFQMLDFGYLLFNHICGSTFALFVQNFTHLYNGPRYKERKTGTPECKRLCHSQTDFTPCSAHCECAYIRHILHEIHTYPKN
jgi:hypothetical protein